MKCVVRSATFFVHFMNIGISWWINTITFKRLFTPKPNVRIYMKFKTNFNTKSYPPTVCVATHWKYTYAYKILMLDNVWPCKINLNEKHLQCQLKRYGQAKYIKSNLEVNALRDWRQQYLISESGQGLCSVLNILIWYWTH